MNAMDLDFEALKVLSGAPYEAVRRRFLASPGPRDALAMRAASPDWRTAVTAKILLGWADHGAEYEALLTEIDAEDLAAANRTMPGIQTIWKKYARRAAAQYRERILPLAWEVVLKRSDWPTWKVVTFFRMLMEVPHDASIEPLAWFIETTDSDMLAQSAAAALAVLPRDRALARLAAARARLDVIGRRLRSASTEMGEPIADDDEDG